VAREGKARTGGVRLAFGAGVLLAAVFVAALRLGVLQGSVGMGSVRRQPAPELAGIAGWINSPPLSLATLRGKVVLVDFWTYSCVNCVRTFPALRALYARYHSAGLEIIGVHSPEFDFEKVRANIEAAVRRFMLPYPVAMDNDMATWRAFNNHYWPHVFLVDAMGHIRADHIGEGGEDLIQNQVRTLLGELGRPLPEPLDFTEDLPSAHITPEIYAGYARGEASGSLASPEGFREGEIVAYAEPESRTVRDAGPGGVFFLAGRWRNAAELVRAESAGAKVILPFYARDVFVVARGPATVRVLLDGRPVAAAAAASDVHGANLRVGGPRLYRVIALPKAGAHVLTLVAGRGFSLFTFTFG
jgi:thiol-disulfide isomerase/thioredoxin